MVRLENADGCGIARMNRIRVDLLVTGRQRVRDARMKERIAGEQPCVLWLISCPEGRIIARNEL
jgi:hypothetical protein